MVKEFIGKVKNIVIYAIILFAVFSYLSHAGLLPFDSRLSSFLEFDQAKKACKDNVEKEMRSSSVSTNLELRQRKIVETKKFSSISKAAQFANKYPDFGQIPFSERIESKVSDDNEFYISIGFYELRIPIQIRDMGHTEFLYDIFVCDIEGNLI